MYCNDILGNNIKRARIEKDLSQEDLAHLSDLTTSTIGRLERGAANPTLLTLSQVAKPLGKEPYELLQP